MPETPTIFPYIPETITVHLGRPDENAENGHSRAIPSFPSQLEWKIGLAWANTRGSLNSPA